MPGKGILNWTQGCHQFFIYWKYVNPWSDTVICQWVLIGDSTQEILYPIGICCFKFVGGFFFLLQSPYMLVVEIVKIVENCKEDNK